ncbi:cytochrome C [Leptospira ryugenii]|uniref:Cytochrome C n=1 Tax=Leptospira ryugenii TaxID=1917863 RepID=A0A2P2DZG0_9LEPT|nr:cytochrome c [Leptospira ryugenii]GBF50010.1 cytochrome C [Leptospira ryugenii]
MKKFFLFLLGLTAILFFIVSIIYIQTNSRLTKVIEGVGEISVFPPGANDLVEGKRLYVTRGCPDCHGLQGQGVTFINDPLLGTFTGSNLTKGQGGLGKKSFQDFVLALRHGIGTNKQPLHFMPSTDFQAMTDEDVGKIYSYLLSLPPVEETSAEIKIGPLARVLFLTGNLPHLASALFIDHSVQAASKQEKTLSLSFGKYLADTCTGCHGANLKGGPIPGAPPEWPEATNITKQGIGAWSEDQFVSAIRTGITPDGREMRAPMPWKNFAYMTDVELKSIRMYLMSL